MRRMQIAAAGLVIITLAGIVYLVTRPGPQERNGYDPGPVPSIGPIQHEAVFELPTPRDRLTYGIGEEVRLWIDPQTWRDTDYELVASPDAPGGFREVEVSDELGAVIWTVRGAGTVYPTVGTSTLLTIDLAGDDSELIVQTQVRDSEAKGLDAPLSLEKVFQALIPKGVEVVPVEP